MVPAPPVNLVVVGNGQDKLVFNFYFIWAVRFDVIGLNSTSFQRFSNGFRKCHGDVHVVHVVLIVCTSVNHLYLQTIFKVCIRSQKKVSNLTYQNDLYLVF